MIQPPLASTGELALAASCLRARYDRSAQWLSCPRSVTPSPSCARPPDQQMSAASQRALSLLLRQRLAAHYTRRPYPNFESGVDTDFIFTAFHTSSVVHLLTSLSRPRLQPPVLPSSLTLEALHPLVTLLAQRPPQMVTPFDHPNWGRHFRPIGFLKQ